MKGFLSSGADGSKIGVVLVFFLAVPPLASAACAPNNLQLILPNRVSDGTKSTTQFQALGNGFPDTPVPKLFDLNGAVTIGTVISSSTFEIDFSVPTTTLFAPGVYQGIIGNADVNCPSSVSKQVVSNFSKANFPALGETSVPSTAQAKDQFLGFERDLTKNSAIETRSAFGGASEGIYEIAGLGAHAFEDWMRNRGPSQIAADLVNCSGPGTLPLLQIIENPSFRLLGGSLNRCTDYVGGEDSPVDPYWEAVRAKVRKEREAKARSECANNLKQSGIAIRSYSDLFCSEDPYYFITL